MSKKRLYEIAKEVGVASKEVVAKAQELGMSVKSHASSVEGNDIDRLTSAFKTSPNIKVLSNQKSADSEQSKVKPQENKIKEDTSKQSSKEVEEVKNPITKPQSRNFKAEREAKAKLASQKQNNRQHYDKAKNNTRKSLNDSKYVGQGQKQSDKQQKTFSKGQRTVDNQQGKTSLKESANKRQQKAMPNIDFKARAAALKAEQNAEYSRQSEVRFREEEAKRQQKKAQAAALKAQKKTAAAPQKDRVKSEPIQVTAVDALANTTTNIDTRRRKQNRSEKMRDFADRNEDGYKQEKNKKNRTNQNQVRNQRNSNWKKNKNNKKMKNNRNGNNAPKPVTERKYHELPKEFEYTEGMTVAEIAKRIKREPAEIVKKLFMMGIIANQNQSLDGEAIELLMYDYGIEAKAKVEVDTADIERFFVDKDYLNPDKMVERAPVVTIMGHVDHGKTTLLDTLRNTRVANAEAGGITQHIGAYQIEAQGKKITFLDTPGHAAFTSMRARGASVTDITVLIVAADDGVKPQTIEAINHSKAAGVPIIVAINKIDKPGANPGRVIGELAAHGVYQAPAENASEFVEISAKYGKNIDELIETINIVAEMEELKADPTVRAIGTVIEARLDKGKGSIATLLVQQGTLNVSDPIVVGNTFGRVRAMVNDLGRRVKSALPSTPVSITGLNDTPMAGDHFAVYADEKAARAAGEERAKRALMKHRQTTQRVSLDNLFDHLKAGEIKTVNVIIKADVQGSVEALANTLQKIDVEGVRVNVVHSAVGAINESDVGLAEASNAVIIGFNVRPTPQARQQAEADGVEIRHHNVIYDVEKEVKKAMEGKLDPKYVEKVIGEAVIREIFKVSKVGTIGGFMVTSGKITRDSSARVVRQGVVVYTGKLASLKHYKDDVKEVGNGQEGGLMFETFNDLKEDDIIEAYIMEEIKNK